MRGDDEVGALLFQPRSEGWLRELFRQPRLDLLPCREELPHGGVSAEPEVVRARIQLRGQDEADAARAEFARVPEGLRHAVGVVVAGAMKRGPHDGVTLRGDGELFPAQ